MIAAFVSAGRVVGFVLDVEGFPVAAGGFGATAVSVGPFFGALPLPLTLVLPFAAGAVSTAPASCALLEVSLVSAIILSTRLQGSQYRSACTDRSPRWER